MPEVKRKYCIRWNNRQDGQWFYEEIDAFDSFEEAEAFGVQFERGINRDRAEFDVEPIHSWEVVCRLVSEWQNPKKEKCDAFCG